MVGYGAKIHDSFPLGWSGGQGVVVVVLFNGFRRVTSLGNHPNSGELQRLWIRPKMSALHIY